MTQDSIHMIVRNPLRLRCWQSSMLVLALLTALFVRQPIAVAQQRALSTRTDERPNIVLFLSDDHRADHMGCAGHPFLKTPTMDRLAQQGTRFNNMFVTTSICAASRATIFTGLYERGHRYSFGTVPLAATLTSQSYPTLLRESGYRTGFVGKFGVAVQRGEREKMFDAFQPLNRAPYFKKQADGSERHITEICADRAIEFLDAQDPQQPFCLSISFNAPHAEDGDKQNHYPWPKVMNGMYDDITVQAPRLSEPEVFESQPEFLKKSLNRQRWFWRWDTPEKYQKNIRAYYRMLSGVDHSMGRVLDHLEKRGMAENTIVIFTGDNGYYLGSRGFAGKWSHYEESLRTPLIIFDPRLPESLRGNTVDAMTLNVDLSPTMLDYAGVAIPSTYQGQSLKTWLSNDSPREWRTDTFIEHLMHYPDGIPKYEGVRGERWVYARYFEQEPVFEFLHDLETDPDQLRNLATDPDFASQLDQMRERCETLKNKLGGDYSLEKFPRRR